jgi:hypothetical protein
MSAGRRYRVVQEFQWIEGGNLAPDASGWEGGEIVIYKPGDFVCFQEDEVGSKYHCLEALDDAGRVTIKEARAKVEAPAKTTAVADLTPNFVELWTRALDEKRRLHGSVPEYAVRRDGTEYLLRYVPTNPLLGVIYGDDGLPDTWATARQRRRQKEERKLARIEAGAERGRRKGLETKRADAAHAGEELLPDVRAHRAKHPNHGRPAIAEALLAKHGREFNPADPAGRKKAIGALVKRIERLEKKSLDT